MPRRRRSPLGVDSDSVHVHLTIEQGIIARMADNSRHCKLWCITIVSAILFFAARSESLPLVLTALIPLCLLGSLDAYYLAQERTFRGCNQGFVRKLHRQQLRPSDLFVWKVTSVYRRWLRSFWSISVGMFYFALISTIGLVWLLRIYS